MKKSCIWILDELRVVSMLNYLYIAEEGKEMMIT